MDVCALSAVELRAALRRGELSAVDALEAVLERADEITATVNPFTIRLDPAAREAAKAADEVLARGEGGPLCGIPVTTKDSHWMAGSKAPLAHAPGAASCRPRPRRLSSGSRPLAR